MHEGTCTSGADRRRSRWPGTWLSHTCPFPDLTGATRATLAADPVNGCLSGRKALHVSRTYLCTLVKNDDAAGRAFNRKSVWIVESFEVCGSGAVKKRLAAIPARATVAPKVAAAAPAVEVIRVAIGRWMERPTTPAVKAASEAHHHRSHHPRRDRRLVLPRREQVRETHQRKAYPRCAARNANMLPARHQMPHQRLRVQQLPVHPLPVLHETIIPRHRTHCRQGR